MTPSSRKILTPPQSFTCQRDEGSEALRHRQPSVEISRSRRGLDIPILRPASANLSLNPGEPAAQRLRDRPPIPLPATLGCLCGTVAGDRERAERRKTIGYSHLGPEISGAKLNYTSCAPGHLPMQCHNRYAILWLWKHETIGPLPCDALHVARTAPQRCRRMSGHLRCRKVPSESINYPMDSG
jgi:hypothetical protein